MNNPNLYKKTESRVNLLLIGLSIISTGMMLGWVLQYCNYGFDFTDEGLYLVWIKSPFNYTFSTTQFGFIYHPLYELFEGNIANLRQANILLNFSLSWIFANVFFKTVFSDLVLPSCYRLFISATFASTSLIFLNLWLPTPSYNSLAFQSLLVVVIGSLLANKTYSYTSIFGWFLIGLGGWMAFMGKPTTAAALCVFVSFYLFSDQKMNMRLLMISIFIALSLVALSAFIIDGSISEFINRIKSGVEMSQILSQKHDISNLIRLDSFDLTGELKAFLIASFVTFGLTLYLHNKEGRVASFTGTALSILFPLISMLIIFRLFSINLKNGYFQGLLVSAVPYGVILASILVYKFKGFKNITRSEWVLSIYCLTFPYAYTFGSADNYWVAEINVSIFWIFAGLIFLSSFKANKNFIRILITVGLAGQLITTILVSISMDSPYRNSDSLHRNNTKIELGSKGSEIFLSQGFAQYIKESVSFANRANFKVGTPMIDLTGQSPGLLYALGANNIGQPWTIGGYPGSNLLAFILLNEVPCEQIASAWLLTELDGPRKISSKILAGSGANLEEHYEVVGTFTTPKGAGGYQVRRGQQMMKPLRSYQYAMNSCTIARSKLVAND